MFPTAPPPFTFIKMCFRCNFYFLGLIIINGQLLSQFYFENLNDSKFFTNIGHNVFLCDFLKILNSFSTIFYRETANLVYFSSYIIRLLYKVADFVMVS